MKKAFLRNFIKRGACILLVLTMMTGTAACSNEAIDGYLETLGMKDSESDENSSSNPSSDASQSSSIFEPLEDLLEEAEKKMDEREKEDAKGDDNSAADFASSFASAYASGASSDENALSGSGSSGAEGDLASSGSASAASTADTAASGSGTGADAAFQSSYTDKKSVGNQDDKAAREAIGLSEEGINAKRNEQAGRYAYERLTDSGKTLYVEILTILQHQAEGIVVSTTSVDAIEMVFDYVMVDHPEIFYVTACKYTNYTVASSTTKIAFSGIYAYGPEEVQRRQTLINDAVSRCLAGAPSSSDQYYAIKYVYEYIITNTDYAPGAEDNQNICSVFLNKRSVCNGYAKAAQLLLNKLGIECTLVTGTVHTRNGSSERHAWNLVKCNGQYYYLDVTWGDASYQTVSGESADASKLPSVNYDYLNVTTAEITKNHTLPDYIYMPTCNSMTDNYFVREGIYFTSPELSLVGDLFARGYSEGSRSVTIKCANDSVYHSLFDELVTNRRVFDYLQGNPSTISYTTFEETDTIIFWI